MIVLQEVEINEKSLWSGAIDTYKTVKEAGKLEELSNLLDEVFQEIPTLTAVNDLLRFDDDYVYSSLGIETEEDE